MKSIEDNKEHWEDDLRNEFENKCKRLWGDTLTYKERRNIEKRLNDILLRVSNTVNLDRKD